MATVKDGMKIGLGLFLFQWFLGAICCVTLGGVTWCIVSGSGSTSVGPQTSPPSSEWSHSETSQAHPAKPTVVQSVEFAKKCNVRGEPDGASEKIGVAVPGKRYLVEKRQGQWRQITLDNGKVGWAGCAIAKKPESTSELP